jgi:SAM-dependent methyltransferase
MPLLTQSRFPGAWLLFQKLFGGTPDKQRLVLERYRGQARILEIGCSVGNLAEAFRLPGIAYTGIDVDRSAIDHARRRLGQQPNLRFLRASPEDLLSEGQRFDYVLIAGVLHHVDDATASGLVRTGLALLASDGSLVVSEPEELRRTDNTLFKIFYRLEQGQYLRSVEALASLVQSSGARISFIGERLVSPGLVSWPKVARFTLIEAQPLDKAERTNPD